MTNINAIAQQFTDYLNEWHSYREPYNDRLDAWLHELYAKEKRKFKQMDWKSVYFSPSSAGSCNRELYVKAKKMPKDDEEVKPWRRRWTAQGTAIGDWLQREILLAERHFEQYTGKQPAFKMALTDEGAPFFEDFVKTQRFFEHNGRRFSLLGTCDGVLEMTDEETGEIKRIGLEIKSKQTTAAQTSLHTMREPKQDHIKQVTCYSLMYDLDDYLIVYVNASKKAWFMSDEEFAKTPDFRVFGVEVTDDMKTAVLDKFAEVARCVANETPPSLDLESYRFNNFKRSCALSLSEEELAILKAQVRRAMKSGLPEWKKQSYYDAFMKIEEIREGQSA